MPAWLDATVKWVLLDFQADLKAGSDNRCRLYYGDGARFQPPAAGIAVHSPGHRKAFVDELGILTDPRPF